MRVRKFVLILAIVVASRNLLSCGIGNCTGEDIRGILENVTSTTALINGTNMTAYACNYVNATMNNSTEIIDATVEPNIETDKSRLEPGQFVSACFVGPIAESYPCQATAGRIVILSNATTN